MYEINKRLLIARIELYGERGKSKLCRDLKMPKASYQGYEKKKKIPADFIKKFCETTGVNCEWLIFNTGEMIKPFIPQSKPIKRTEKRKTKTPRRSGKPDRRMNINTLYVAINKIKSNSDEVLKEIGHCSKVFGNEVAELCTLNTLLKMIRS